MRYVVYTLLAVAGTFGTSLAEASCASAAARFLRRARPLQAPLALEQAAPGLPVRQAKELFRELAPGAVDAARACAGEAECPQKAAEGFFRRQVLSKISALNGSHLRRSPVCMANFRKTLGLAWTFQLGGYGIDYLARRRSGEASQDVPFDILANTALLVWLQQEIACRQTVLPTGVTTAGVPATFKDFLKTALRIDRKGMKTYLQESWGRYRELLYTIPFGLFTYTTLAATEDAIRREVDIFKDGESERPEVFSREYLGQFRSHAFFIGVFESVLFLRLSIFNTPLELKLLPAFQSVMKAGGRAGVGNAVEWAAYRIPMGLVDGWILNWWKGRSEKVMEGFNWSPEVQQAIDESDAEDRLQ